MMTSFTDLRFTELRVYIMIWAGAELLSSERYCWYVFTLDLYTHTYLHV